MRLLLVLAVACGAPQTSDPTLDPEPRPEDTEPSGAVAEPEPDPAGPGEACEGPPFQEGTCAAGLVCAPGPGGYCTAPCFGGGACPDGSACTETIRAGKWCLASCDDCREGYVCDEASGTCFLPDWHVPTVAACDAELPPRREVEVHALSAGQGRYAIEPAAALGPDGSVVVAYMAMGTPFEPSRIVTVRVNADGSVTEPRALEHERTQHFDPWMAAGPDGTLHLVWLAHDGRGDQNAMIAYSRSTDGLTWSEPRAIHDADTDCPDRHGCLDKPMVAVAPDGPHRGRIHVLYFGAGDGGSLRAIHSDDGETWSDSVKAGTDAYGDVLVDGRGRVHVVYGAGAEGTNRFGDPDTHVVYTRSDDGGETFGEPTRVSDEEHSVPFYFSNPTLALTRSSVHVAYPAGTPDGAWRLYLATLDGSEWTQTEVGGQACPNRMTPTLATDRRGDLHLLFPEGGGGTGAMMHVRCRRGRCEDPERLSAPFAAYSLVRHDAIWRGEYDALLAGPRALHAVWTQPVDEDGTPTSRVFHASF